MDNFATQQCDCLCIQHHLPTAADYLLTEAQLSGQLCYTAVWLSVHTASFTHCSRLHVNRGTTQWTTLLHSSATAESWTNITVNVMNTWLLPQLTNYRVYTVYDIHIQRYSAVIERPCDALCHWIFRYVSQGHSRSFEMTPLSRAHVSPY